MVRKSHAPLPILLLACLVLLSCEKIDLSDIDPSSESQDGTVSVTFCIANIEQVPFDNTTTRANAFDTRASVSDFCSRFSLAVFQNGTKLRTVHQSSDESSFGSITLSLLPGQYQLVAIAHNGSGNCTITSPDKVTFPNNRLTDTFYFYGTLDITDSSTASSPSSSTSSSEEPSLVPLTLRRPVSMFRLILTDAIPSNVVQMKFYYTGGSSTFNPTSGYGCVNSKQTETFSLTNTTQSGSVASTSTSFLSATHYSSPSGETEGCCFEIYTFPHSANDFLDINITALDAQGQTVAEKSLNNIYIQPNVITQHTCRFFNDSIPSTVSFSIDNDGRWSDIFEQ